MTRFRMTTVVLTLMDFLDEEGNHRNVQRFGSHLTAAAQMNMAVIREVIQ